MKYLQLLTLVLATASMITGCANNANVQTSTKQEDNSCEACITQSLKLGRARKIDESIEWATKAIAADPKSARAYTVRGAGYCESKDYAKATADGEKAVELNPNELGGYVVIAQAAQGKKEYKKAIDNYQKAIQVDPKHVTANVYLQLAYSYTQIGQNDTAIQVCKQGLERHKRGGYLLLFLGDIYGQEKNYEESVQAYTKALKLDSRVKYAYLKRAEVYDKLGKKDLAIEDRKTAETLR